MKRFCNVLAVLLFGLACFMGGRFFGHMDGPRIVRAYMGAPEWWIKGIPSDASAITLKCDTVEFGRRDNWYVHDIDFNGRDVGPRPGYCDPRIGKSVDFKDIPASWLLEDSGHTQNIDHQVPGEFVVCPENETCRMVDGVAYVTGGAFDVPLDDWHATHDVSAGTNTLSTEHLPRKKRKSGLHCPNDQPCKTFSDAE